MLTNDEDAGTGSEDLTIESAAAGFTKLLSAEEDPKPRETPPAPKPASDDEEKAPEADDSEDTPAETDDPPADADENPEPETLDPTVTVKVVIDGKEEEVTLEEALKGYSRTADYTRKTQEIAAQRKAQEAEFQAVRGELAKYATLLTQLEQALAEPEPDWAKIQRESPQDFPVLWAEYSQREAQRKAVAEERSKAEQAVQRDSAEALQRYVSEEHAKLLEALPAWKDERTAKADKAELVAFAEKVGFTKDELSGVADHRLVLLLHKAMQHDKAQAKKPAIAQRIEKVKTATPGPTPQAKKPVSEVTKARQRLAKTGRIEDAAAAFSNMLGDL